MVVKPYKDQWLGNSKRLRVFDSNTNQEEFVWHQDSSDREIKVINGDNWKLQYDNEMPITLQINETYYIPKNIYHRIIKGENDLIIIIEETVI